MDSSTNIKVSQPDEISPEFMAEAARRDYPRETWEPSAMTHQTLVVRNICDYIQFRGKVGLGELLLKSSRDFGMPVQTFYSMLHAIIEHFGCVKLDGGNAVWIGDNVKVHDVPGYEDSDHPTWDDLKKQAASEI